MRPLSSFQELPNLGQKLKHFNALASEKAFQVFSSSETA